MKMESYLELVILEISKYMEEICNISRTKELL